jgi:hypothetical protein
VESDLPAASGGTGGVSDLPDTGWLTPWRAPLERLAGIAEVALAALGVAGAGLFVATVSLGRTAIFWPSLAWIATASIAGLVAFALWLLAALLERSRGIHRWRSTAWPQLLLLPATLAAAATYLDDGSNHLLRIHDPAREALLVYGLGLYAVAQVAFWTLRLVSRVGVTWWTGTARLFPAVAVGVAAGAYLNASVFQQWVPTQTDLLVNLRGARELLAGGLPYNDYMPVWADRVHMLPVTLLVLFAPLAALPDNAARLLFFLGNQVLWLLALALLIRRVAPEGQRPYWYAALLAFSAAYWPWQEAIRYGQQDGLLILLYIFSLTAVLRGRSTESGVALGLAFIVKPLSIWLPLAYVVHGRWRALFVAGATGALIVALSLPFTGFEPWWHFARVEVPEMLPGTARGTNIPLPSLHARLFVGRERLGDGDPAPTLGVISALNAATNVLGLALVSRLALRPGPNRRRDWLLDFGITLTLTLLLAPMAWQHYSSWLVIAFVIAALPAVWRPLAPPVRALAGALAGAGFFLLSLDDVKLLHFLTPLVERWPAVMSFYALGLVCVLGALVVARFCARAEVVAVEVGVPEALPAPTVARVA